MLDPRAEGFTIVVAGAWNIRIFTPKWIAENLARSDAISVAVSIGNATAPLRLQFDGCTLLVGAERLIVSPLTLDSVSLSQVERISKSILETLSHTPITAIGVNLRYALDIEGTALVDVFELADTHALSDFGAIISTTTIRRAISKPPFTANLSFELKESGKATADVNFHLDTTEATQALAHIEVGFAKYRQFTETLITEIYSGQLTQGQNV